MRVIHHILLLLIAIATLHPIATICLDRGCEHPRFIARTAAHACCETVQEEGASLACHSAATAVQDSDVDCVSCKVSTTPAVRDSVHVADVVLAIAPIEPVLWLAPIQRATVEKSEPSIVLVPPTLLSLHTMLTC